MLHQSFSFRVFLMSHFLTVPLSRSKACGRHALGHGHAVCPGEERSEDVPSDPLQPLPQDQCEAGRHQQHPGASPTVSFCFDSLLISCTGLCNRVYIYKSIVSGNTYDVSVVSSFIWSSFATLLQFHLKYLKPTKSCQITNWTLTHLSLWW